MIKHFVFTLAIGASLISCKSKKEVADQPQQNEVESTQDTSDKTPNTKEDQKVKDAYLTVETTPCFGQCPVYTLTISNNGGVLYNGKNFTKVSGTQTGTLNPEQLKELKSRVAQLGVKDLKESYDNPNVTDLPSTYYTFYDGSKTKKVVARYEVPEKIKQFQKYIDQLINEINWEENEIH